MSFASVRVWLLLDADFALVALRRLYIGRADVEAVGETGSTDRRTGSAECCFFVGDGVPSQAIDDDADDEDDEAEGTGEAVSLLRSRLSGDGRSGLVVFEEEAGMGDVFSLSESPPMLLPLLLGPAAVHDDERKEDGSVGPEAQGCDLGGGDIDV